MKSMLLGVQALYDHLLIDMVNLHPSDASAIERDFSRLRKAADSCGLPFYTIALPQAAKWFDKSLSEGCLIEPRPPHFGVKGKGDKRPSFLFGLMSHIFESDGTLCCVVEPEYVKSVRQVLLAAKKLRAECEQRFTDDSVTQYHEIEKSLPQPWEGTWNSDVPSWSHRTGHPCWGDFVECDRQTHLSDPPNSLLQLDFEPDWEGFRRFSGRVLHSLGQFDPAGIATKHGPGAVSDRVASHVKYDFLFWTERLEPVFPYDWHASTDFTVPDYVQYKEFPSKMHAVPKTQSGPRLIAAEPTAHQWIQQGIREWIESRVRDAPIGRFIDFRSQEPSRLGALEASISGDFVTVDLSSASDRLTCRLVEYIFQSNRPLLDGLHACRTRAVTSLTGEEILLSKFASQGSAVIFPLQSYVYCVLALWAVALTRNLREYGSILEASKGVRVYGDDIIVPQDAYPVLAGLLQTCLLKVNQSKTHTTGKFRESCGMDAFQGVEVTPCYLRSVYNADPDTLSSVVECSNNFHKGGYFHTAMYLLETLPRSIRKDIPIGQGVGSLEAFSFCGIETSHLKHRWNRDLHRNECRIVEVASRSPLESGQGNGRLTQYMFENRFREFEPETRCMRSHDIFEINEYAGGQPGQSVLRIKHRWVVE